MNLGTLIYVDNEYCGDIAIYCLSLKSYSSVCAVILTVRLVLKVVKFGYETRSFWALLFLKLLPQSTCCLFQDYVSPGLILTSVSVLRIAQIYFCRFWHKFTCHDKVLTLKSVYQGHIGEVIPIISKTAKYWKWKLSYHSHPTPKHR